MIMRDWDGSCQRCYKEASAHTMSMYSTRLICLDCEAEERKRDDYAAARAADVAAIKSGNYNFNGVGEPKG